MADKNLNELITVNAVHKMPWSETLKLLALIMLGTVYSGLVAFWVLKMPGLVNAV